MPDPRVSRNQRLLRRHLAVRKIGGVAVPLLALVAVVIFPTVPAIKWVGLVLAVSAIGSGLPMLLVMGQGFLALRASPVSSDEAGYGLLLLGYQFMWALRYLLRIPVGLVALVVYLVFGLWPSQELEPSTQVGIAALVFCLALPSELRHQALGLRNFMRGVTGTRF